MNYELLILTNCKYRPLSKEQNKKNSLINER